MIEKIEMTHGKEYFSPSQLKALYVSPGTFDNYINGVKKESDAMSFGTLLHLYLYEPQKFAKNYFVLDDSMIISELLQKGIKRPTATKDYKAWVEKGLRENEGKKAVSTNDFKKLNKIKDKLVITGTFEKFFTGGVPEQTITGVSEGFGVGFNALVRADYVMDDKVIDLKTTSKPLDKFIWEARDFGYDIQAALTMDLTLKPFMFVVVQTVEPFDIAVVTTSDEFLERGARKIKEALLNYDAWKCHGDCCIKEFAI